MFEEYKNEILLEYQSRKELGKLSLNLMELSPGKLRDECIIIYNERPLIEDNEMLRAFFGPLSNSNSYSQLIENIDIDKFKPLIQYLTGITNSTGRKNIELLAWLIDFKPRPNTIWVINEGGQPPIITDSNKPPFIIPRTILALSLFAILSFGAYVCWESESAEIYFPTETQEKCMHWTGNRYEPIACEVQISKTPIIAIDFQKLNHFKKIRLPDKLTKYDLGKVWYAKLYGKVEFYTDSGLHPIETNRKLKPLTEHMLNVHTSYYRYLFNCILWVIGIAISSVILVAISFKYYLKIIVK